MSSLFPEGLPREPFPHEIASRTNYTAMENDVDEAAVDNQRVAEAHRLAVLELLEHHLAPNGQPVEAADILAALDSLAASGRVIPGIEQLVASTAITVEDRLRILAIAAELRTRQSLQAAGITVRPLDPARVNPQGILIRPSSAAEIAAYEQARRLATDSTDAAVRAMRGAAYATPRIGRAVEPYYQDVVRSAVEVGTKALADIALQGALATDGAARTEALTDVVERVYYYASELLDRRTCKPCSQVDGKEYRTEEEMLGDYPGGQYVECLGGVRCRGTAVAISVEEARATLPTPGDRQTGDVRVPGLPSGV